MLSSVLASSKQGLRSAASGSSRALMGTHAARASVSGSVRKPLVLGIRREDKNRWERRVALTPAHVKRLIRETGTTVLVQPSNTRIFNDASFEKAGAIIEEDLSNADAILGIKEVPISKLIPQKTYLIFSHTHKGQAYNMPSLRAFLDKSIRLIDYELMTDPQTQKRLVLFGKHAGYAGMIDGLHGLGQRLLALGYNSPFIHMGQAHVYPNLECVNTKLRHVANIIADQGLPEAFAPMVFTFTGSGNVTQGARAIFDKLPHENITVDDLPRIFSDRFNEKYKTCLLALQVDAKDYLERIDGGEYDRSEYRSHPERYRSVFAQKIAPYTTMLINGIYWESKYPRLLTNSDLAAIQNQRELKNRMLAIADISCDIGGSIEFMSHASTIDSPFFYVDARDGLVEHKDIEKPGVQINSIDNLPTELPFEASKHFGDSLYPFAKALAIGDLDHPVLSQAIICQSGELEQQHQHLLKTMDEVQGIRVGSNSKNNVLLAGSGMVSQPLVEYLAKSKDTDITIGMDQHNDLDEARRLAYQFPNTKVALLNIADTKSLDKLVGECDVVVSLVPAQLHPQIANAAIKRGKNMVTASYLSPEMKKLDRLAKDASVTIINEIGLDPGIDHCSAMQIIDQAHARGDKIKSFISWCGGLTAPEDSNNQLGYKFSWSPRGVLTAGLNSARFKINGELRQIPSGQLFAHKFNNVPLYPGFAFEGLANRDSLQYADIYGLQLDQMDTMFRGTLRYQGYSEILDCLLKLGLLDLDPQLSVDALSATDFLRQALGVRGGSSSSAVAKTIAQKLELQMTDPLLARLMLALEEFGMLDAVSGKLAAPTRLDAMAKILQQALRYKDKERDLVCMSHEFGIESADGKSYNVHSSSLTVYGDSKTGETAMARTVGVPAAIATRLLLEGAVTTYGTIRPTIPEIYNPLIERLELKGIVFKESMKTGIQNSLQRQMTWV
ncbi:hypothetical protein FB645_004542 [Coemansia sp. IMI 203386]|nr:hypothetical protein FB645_004542 [Coemansia sp. IMI 203386]